MNLMDINKTGVKRKVLPNSTQLIPKSQPVLGKDAIIVCLLSDYMVYVVLTTFTVILFQPLNSLEGS